MPCIYSIKILNLHHYHMYQNCIVKCVWYLKVFYIKNLIYIICSDHNIAEILFKLALITNQSINHHWKWSNHNNSVTCAHLLITTYRCIVLYITSWCSFPISDFDHIFGHSINLKKKNPKYRDIFCRRIFIHFFINDCEHADVEHFPT